MDTNAVHTPKPRITIVRAERGYRIVRPTGQATISPRDRPEPTSTRR